MAVTEEEEEGYKSQSSGDGAKVPQRREAERLSTAVDPTGAMSSRRSGSVVSPHAEQRDRHRGIVHPTVGTTLQPVGAIDDCNFQASRTSTVGEELCRAEGRRDSVIRWYCEQHS